MVLGQVAIGVVDDPYHVRGQRGPGQKKYRLNLRYSDAKDGEEVAVETDGDGKDVKVRWSKVEDGKGGEKDGMYEWVCGIAAGKKVQLEAQWDVKAPESTRWEESPHMKS